MDQHCYYITAFDQQDRLQSNGSGFLITHNDQTLLLTAAHTLRKYNDFIFPDFDNWHAEYIKLDNSPVKIYADDSRNPLFTTYKKDDQELLDAVALPFDGKGGPVDLNPQVGDRITLCGWRRDPDEQKFVFVGHIVAIKDWDITIMLISHRHQRRDGISGGGIYTKYGFAGVYFADDIGKPTSHAVSIKHMLARPGGIEPPLQD